ncbi:MAG: amidase family protein [Streptosporangiaceae bacterium]
METTEYAAFSALEIRELVLTGQVPAEEIIRAALARLEETDPLVRAFTEVSAEQALRSARNLDHRAAPKLAGVPIGVKPNAPPPTRLETAGCVVLGRTSVPLATTPWQTWGHTDRGPTRNPWRPDVVAGGSCAGSAAAVAAGIVPLATGGDGAGSVRIPAAWCGIVGLKTTNGLLPVRDRAGLTAPGVLTRTVADAAAWLEVVAGTVTALHDEPTGLRAAWSETLGFLTCDPEVAGIARPAALGLSDLLDFTGAGIVLGDPGQAWHALRGDGEPALRHLNDRPLAALFDEVDLLLTPTTPIQPHGHGGPGEAMTVGFTWAFNLSGHPALSVPAGFTAGGLPVGLQLVAAHGREALLLRVAAALECRRPWPRWS